MEFDPKDREVVDLLAKLKNKDGGYPQDMLAARRQTYLNHMAGLGLGVGFGTMLKNVIKNGNGASFSAPAAGKMLEVALVIAIVVEAGILTYLYRDKMADFFQSISTSPKTLEGTSPPVIASPFPELEISEVPVSATFTEAVTEVPTGTPVPGLAEDLTINNNGEEANLTSSTPNPSGNNGNNGNHYGQTPKPERTKENKKDKPPKNDPGNGNNDKPPKEKGKNK